MDLNYIVSNYRGIQSFIAEAKGIWGEEQYAEVLASWTKELTEQKQNAESTNGKTYHTAVVADIMVNKVDDMEKTDQEKHVAKFMITIAMLELEPSLTLELEKADKKGGKKQ